MDRLFAVHSSEHERDEVRNVAEDDLEYRQARAFRRYFLIRLALVIAGAWLLSWPVHLLPHTVLWTLLATAALVIGLTSTPRTRLTSSDRPLTPQR